MGTENAAREERMKRHGVKTGAKSGPNILFHLKRGTYAPVAKERNYVPKQNNHAAKIHSFIHSLACLSDLKHALGRPITQGKKSNRENKK
jgi:hypothetical protein